MRSTTQRQRPSRDLSSTPVRAMRTLIPRRCRYRRQCRASSPLSAWTCSGRWRGRPRAPRTGWDARDDRREDRRVGALRAGQASGQRQPLAIDRQMTLGTRLAPIGRVRPHRIAPFLARRLALSTETRDQSSAPSAPRRSRIARCSACQTPAICQSRSRRQHVLPLPQPSTPGSACQPQPVLSTNMIPHSARRADRHGRPPLRCGGCGGRSGATSAHRSAGTSVSTFIAVERLTPSAGYATSSYWDTHAPCGGAAAAGVSKRRSST